MIPFYLHIVQHIYLYISTYRLDATSIAGIMETIFHHLNPIVLSRRIPSLVTIRQLFGRHPLSVVEQS
jgi:hypothetical protein